ncbi:Transcription initiation factor IIA small chain (TFIIA 13.5 kDa subunit) [Pichia californica]|uniref:Transcription initiation factor IIA subunit 2 n=1 Tax=Pichia californica TaxID=460514 RepID=A0A9P6WQJ9_9ASCO|nr:Transcription initiation factor IIA small chain (TFIIA 13.5 kDa subunit) [[Candida] californica]KAG0691270.1 Transcription initiation factor IIA small chain (TFIIA 13.5 kDa subunit) [[Candida] californica]
MNGPSYYEFYRRSTVGATLADALDTLIVDQRIQPQLAMKVLANFDRVTSDHLRSDVRAKMTFKGHLSTYRFCDDVWTFVIKDVNMKLDDNEVLDVGKFKIVACNSKKSGE